MTMRSIRLCRPARGWCWRYGLCLLLITVQFLGFTSIAWAADVRGGQDLFRLGADEVVNDDLYITAGEIYIDGTVHGDLIAAGGYVEINGVVTGDALVAAGGIQVNGIVQDDARLAGGGVVIAGKIGKDLLIAGGGRPFAGVPTLPIRVNQQTIAQGVQLANSATVGGDLYVVGGQGDLAGAVQRNVWARMGALSFDSKVGGNADLNAETIVIRDNSKVGGVLRYSSHQATTVPTGVAEHVQAVNPPASGAPTPPNLWGNLLGWLWRTVLIMIGLLLLGWIWVRVLPTWFVGTTQAIAARPAAAGLYGIGVALLMLPVIVALVLLSLLFGGVFLGFVLLFFLLSGVLLLWFFSPLLTGRWLGQQIVSHWQLWSARGSDPLGAVWVGVLLIVLVARLLGAIPFFGLLLAALIYFTSFILALGGIVLSRRRLARVSSE